MDDKAPEIAPTGQLTPQNAPPGVVPTPLKRGRGRPKLLDEETNAYQIAVKEYERAWWRRTGKLIRDTNLGWLNNHEIIKDHEPIDYYEGSGGEIL